MALTCGLGEFEMKILKPCTILLLLSSFISSHAAYVEVTAENVDDRIDIYIDGEHQSTCTWSVNPGCVAGVEGELSGTHDIRFKLTNYVYSGFCIGVCGKYAADLTITINQERAWSKNIHRRNNNRGVKYDQTIRCNFSRGSCWIPE